MTPLRKGYIIVNDTVNIAMNIAIVTDIALKHK